jgi:hypothetical protein
MELTLDYHEAIVVKDVLGELPARLDGAAVLYRGIAYASNPWRPSNQEMLRLARVWLNEEGEEIAGDTTNT